MIEIKEVRKGLQCGGKYELDCDTGRPFLVHETSRKSIPVTLEMLRKVNHVYIEDKNPEEINGM